MPSTLQPRPNKENWAMRIASVFCLAGWLAIYFAKGIISLDIGRVSTGYGMGLLSYVVPVFISEISPKNLRGGLATLNQVNQKMMKSTLIKDLYGEIDRLKAEVYAAREKSGVYIPKERYYQEENERKQMEELQDKYDTQVQESSDLRCKLDATEDRLDQTSNSRRS